MTQLIQAVYEQGVFRPLQPVELAEHEHVSLVVSPAGQTATSDDDEVLDPRPQDEIREALQDAADDLRAGRYRPAEDVSRDLRRKLNLPSS